MYGKDGFVAAGGPEGHAVTECPTCWSDQRIQILGYPPEEQPCPDPWHSAAAPPAVRKNAERSSDGPADAPLALTDAQPVAWAVYVGGLVAHLCSAESSAEFLKREHLSYGSDARVVALYPHPAAPDRASGDARPSGDRSALPLTRPRCSTCNDTGLVDWAPGQIRHVEEPQQPCPDCAPDRASGDARPSGDRSALALTRPALDAGPALRRAAYAWHDRTCPEGEDCRAREIHAQSDPIVRSGNLTAVVRAALDLPAALSSSPVDQDPTERNNP